VKAFFQRMLGKEGGEQTKENSNIEQPNKEE
jgi:hypothetical protein